MSKKTTSLLLGLLATTEAQSNDLNLPYETNNQENLNGYPKELYSETPENLSAYERFLKDNK